MKKKYLKESEVSEMTNRSVATLRNDRYFRRGIPFIKVGRSVRYDLEEIIAWMEAHKVRTMDH
ncbi:MAG: helix-turn-helix domain-containing protein [Desulfobacca sp.]|nr:helix-turn-helix domain-containing protein [Desulfobacca sp.]